MLPTTFHCLVAVSRGFFFTVAKCCAAPPLAKLPWEAPLPMVFSLWLAKGPGHPPSISLPRSSKTVLKFSCALGILTKPATDSNHPASKLQQLEGALGKDLTSGRKATRDTVKNYFSTNAAKPVGSYYVLHFLLTKQGPTCYSDAAAQPQVAGTRGTVPLFSSPHMQDHASHP